MKKKLILTLLSFVIIMFSCQNNPDLTDPIPSAPQKDTIPNNTVENAIPQELPEKQDYYIKGGKEIAVNVDENMLYVWLPQETYTTLQSQRAKDGQPKILYYNHFYTSYTNMFDSVLDSKLLDYKNFVETFIYKNEMALCEDCLLIAPVYLNPQGDTVAVQNHIYVQLKNNDTDLELLKRTAEKYEAYIGRFSYNAYFMICYGANRKLSPLSVANYLIESDEFAMVDIGILSAHEKLD